MANEEPEARGAPIGLFDSGVGGLSLLRHLRAELPQENLLYVADQAHVPYGPRPAAEVLHFSQEISRFLLDQGAKLIVVACNRASAAALTGLRQHFPAAPFVGMEPAVKPGAAQTRTGKVGVLATAGTFDSQRYVKLMAQFAQGIEVFQDRCPGLVEQIEAGHVATAATEAVLRAALEPMLAAGVDTLILGCTHYPFVMPLIQRIAGPEVTIIDPAPAVARQARRLLEARGLLNEGNRPATIQAFTSGDPSRLAALAAQLLPELPYLLPVKALTWRD